MKKNVLKMPDFYIQILITIVGIFALSLGITLILDVHSGYDPLDGFFAAFVAMVQHVFPASGWDYTNGKYSGYVIWIFMCAIFLIDLLILFKLKKLHSWVSVVQLAATVTYVFLSGKLVMFWNKVLQNNGFTNYIEKLWSNNNYALIVVWGAVGILILAIGVATFVRGFLFQGPYNGFTIWGCTAFKIEYKYMRIGCDLATGVISIIIFLIALPPSDYKSIFGLATISPFFFGYLVEIIIKLWDKIIGKYAKIRL